MYINAIFLYPSNGVIKLSKLCNRGVMSYRLKINLMKMKINKTE